MSSQTATLSLALLFTLAAPARMVAAEPPSAVPPATAAIAPEPTPAPQATDPGRPRSAQLEDGLTVTLAPLPGARWSSLRFVVKVGSRQDPMGKEGLAHMVEHLIFQRMPERDPLLDDIRAVGGAVNALTSAEATTFILDAPTEHFPALAERFIALVTDPSLELSLIERENGVIATEVEHQSDVNMVTRYIEDALFTRENRPIGGTVQSRGSIELKDVIEFFNRYYTSQNMVAVFSGPLEFEPMRTLVDRAIRIPPSMTEELARVRPRKTLPTLPYTQSIRAPVTLVVHGYLIEEQDAPSCEQLADVIGLRLELAMEQDEERPTSISVECVRMHESQFLFAFAFTGSLSGSDLPETINAFFAKARTLKPTAREKKVAARRQSRRGWREAHDSAAIAERLANEAVRGTAAAVPGGSDVPSIESVAARTFVESHQLLLTFSPFEG